MSKYFSSIYTKLDLRICKTPADFEKIRDDNGIPEEKIDGKRLMALKKDCDFLFYDTNTYCIVAFIHKGEKEIKFVEELTDYFMSLPSLSFKKEVDFSELEIDAILDKISANGMASLTKKEKAFLESDSKK